jgi:hypothetical protein
MIHTIIAARPPCIKLCRPVCRATFITGDMK